MVRPQLVSAALVWAGSLCSVLASPAPVVSVRTRNLPGTTDEFTIREVRRRLTALVYGKRDTVFKNSTSIEKSWDDSVLFTQYVACLELLGADHGPTANTRQSLWLQFGSEQY